MVEKKAERCAPRPAMTVTTPVTQLTGFSKITLNPAPGGAFPAHSQTDPAFLALFS